MARTRRLIQENLSEVDIVLELLDARIPLSSRNPEIEKICGQKPRLTLLTKTSLADPRQNDAWKNELSKKAPVLFIDCITGQNLNRIAPAVREALAAKVEKYEEKGMSGRALKAMVVGIPNVGKSSLINRLAGAKKAKVENRPGVTLIKQWIPTSIGLTLMDMPGVLWPKFEDQRVGLKLAFTGAIKDTILDTETLAAKLADLLMKLYPEELTARYKLKDDAAGLHGYDLLEEIGRRRGLLIAGGEVSLERAAALLLDEFRSGTIGRITLDRVSSEWDPDQFASLKNGLTFDEGADHEQENA